MNDVSDINKRGTVKSEKYEANRINNNFSLT